MLYQPESSLPIFQPGEQDLSSGQRNCPEKWRRRRSRALTAGCHTKRNIPSQTRLSPGIHDFWESVHFLGRSESVQIIESLERAAGSRPYVAFPSQIPSLRVFQGIISTCPTNTTACSLKFEMVSSSMLKQIAAGRRKPDMSRKEYFDHRFCVHGELSDGVEDINQKPQ